MLLAHLKRILRMARLTHFVLFGTFVMLTFIGL